MITDKQDSHTQNVLAENENRLRLSSNLPQAIVYPNQNMLEDVSRVYNSHNEDCSDLKLNYKRSNYGSIVEKNNILELNSAGCSPSSFPNSSKSETTNSPVDQKTNYFENHSIPLHMRTNLNSALPNSTLISNGGHFITEGILNSNRLVAHSSQTHADFTAYQQQQLNQALRSHNYQHAQGQLHIMENFSSIEDVVPSVGVTTMINPDLAQSLNFSSSYTHQDFSNHSFFSHHGDNFITYHGKGNNYNASCSSENERSLDEAYTEEHRSSPNERYSYSNASEIDYERSSTNTITDEELKVLSVRELNRRLRGNK